MFVSHASEDKSFVVPLADLLSRLGLRVWLDIGELSVGDSLSRSIDQGLASSRFGIVVLSKSFFMKDWPDYELRSLMAKELGRDKVILPIWHGVDRSDILDFSPILADKLALSSSQIELHDLACKLVDAINPELGTSINRRLMYLRHLAELSVKEVKISQIKLSRRRHEMLPASLIWRVRSIRASLLDVYPLSFETWVDGFLRDAHPTQEVEAWERFTAVFREIVAEGEWRLEDKKAVYAALFPLLMGLGKPSLDDVPLSQGQKDIMAEAMAGPRIFAAEMHDIPDEEERASSAPPDLETFDGPMASVDQELLAVIASNKRNARSQ